MLTFFSFLLEDEEDEELDESELDLDLDLDLFIVLFLLGFTYSLFKLKHFKYFEDSFSIYYCNYCFSYYNYYYSSNPENLPYGGNILKFETFFPEVY